MRRQAIALAAALLMLTPLAARAADLTVWWERGFYAQEDAAVREIVAAFEQHSGTRVELDFYVQSELADGIITALQSGRPPDVAFGSLLGEFVGQWAFDDRLVDLAPSLGALAELFEPDALAWWTLPNRRTGQRALYALSMGRNSMYLHVWTSLLQRAGFAIKDIPERWPAFWSFWCDRVQPAVRAATGRDDIWAVGLAMSGDAVDTDTQFHQFRIAYGSDYVTRDGRLVIDDPEVRRRLVAAVDGYTMIYRKGCTPPDAISWGNIDNNERFHAQTVVMTANNSLSIPNALKRERPVDYYQNTRTIAWPLGPDGEAFPVRGSFWPLAVFKDGGHAASAEAFVGFLVGEGWLAHYLDFSGERMLPAMPQLLQQPFWLDPGDPHRMAAVMQVEARPMQHDYATLSGNWRHVLVDQQRVWPQAIHRVVTEGVTPEQAVDEAIARIKQILAE